jgi:ribonuclease E
VLRRLLECLARDRTKHQVAEVTSLGLVQMTRKRVGSGLLEAFSEACECCNGRGLLIFLDGVDHGGSGHRGRSDGAAAKDGKTQRDGKAGKDGRRQRQGKPDKDGPAEDKPAAAASSGPGGAGDDTTAAGDDTTAAGDDTTAAGADAGAAGSAEPGHPEAAGNGTGAGEQADTGPAQPFGGRRRRRAATREPGPPDMAAEPAGQTAPEASAAAGV